MHVVCVGQFDTAQNSFYVQKSIFEMLLKPPMISSKLNKNRDDVQVKG